MHNETIQDRWPTAKAIPNNSQSLFGFESCQSSRTCRPTWNSLKPLSSHYPTPTVWRSGGTLLTICGPCLSPSTLRRVQGSRTGSASWGTFQCLASIQSNVVKLGVTGLAYFCRHNNGRALRDAPCKEIGCRAETLHHSYQQVISRLCLLRYTQATFL